MRVRRPVRDASIPRRSGGSSSRISLVRACSLTFSVVSIVALGIVTVVVAVVVIVVIVVRRRDGGRLHRSHRLLGRRRFRGGLPPSAVASRPIARLLLLLLWLFLLRLLLFLLILLFAVALQLDDGHVRRRGLLELACEARSHARA